MLDQRPPQPCLASRRGLATTLSLQTEAPAATLDHHRITCLRCIEQVRELNSCLGDAVSLHVYNVHRRIAACNQRATSPTLHTSNTPTTACTGAQKDAQLVADATCEVRRRLVRGRYSCERGRACQPQINRGRSIPAAENFGSFRGERRRAALWSSLCSANRELPSRRGGSYGADPGSDLGVPLGPGSLGYRLMRQHATNERDATQPRASA